MVVCSATNVESCLCLKAPRGFLMNILVTGAKGMVGTALCNNLKNIRDGKNKTRPALDIKEIYEYDLDSTPEELDEYCRKADFVFNLAGVNRPENPEDFMKGNFGFASDLLNCLKLLVDVRRFLSTVGCCCSAL